MKEKKFEEALEQLEGIVGKLEGGELSLEDSLKSFEEGVRLTRFCHRKLNDIEKKIEILTKDQDGNEKVEPFDPESTAE